MIIPVFDIMNNDCVSGKSGNRSTYTKLKSIYGTNLIEIVTNLKKNGAKSCYIADLDKIENKGDNSNLISKINDILPVMLDNGISNIQDIEKNSKISTWSILGTETLTSIDETIKIFDKINNNNLIISIDIKNNKLLVKNKDINLDMIISLVNQVKPKYVIILDITQVGTMTRKNNSITDEIIKQTKGINHILAGGITNDTIKKYSNQNINDFLIGTILHNGTLEYKL